MSKDEVWDALQYEVTVDDEGTKRYKVDGVLHREDGPAFITKDNKVMCWCKFGLSHRTDGPAIIHSDGSKFWFINGVEYTELEFHRWCTANKG